MGPVLSSAYDCRPTDDYIHQETSLLRGRQMGDGRAV